MKTITEYIQKKHINEVNYVDLDLPSGTKWAKYNIGVDPMKLTKLEDWYGLYFAWGETKGYKALEKHDFSLDNYQFSKKDDFSKYNKEDKLTQLEQEDDAAYQMSKGEFRMPTDKELKELYEYTDNKWVENYNSIEGLNGRLFTSKKDKTKSIFIPASGYRYGSDFNSGDYFYLWSSILYSTDPFNADYLNADADCIYIYINARFYGFAVRGVLY